MFQFLSDCFAGKVRRHQARRPFAAEALEDRTLLSPHCLGAPGNPEHGWCEMPEGSAMVLAGIGAPMWPGSLTFGQMAAGTDPLVVSQSFAKRWSEGGQEWLPALPRIGTGERFFLNNVQVGELPGGTIFAVWGESDGIGTFHAVFAAQLNATTEQWVEMGEGSLEEHGIIGPGVGFYSTLGFDREGMPVVAWAGADDDHSVSQIFVRRWNGSMWEEMGTGSAAGGGVSGTEETRNWSAVLGQDADNDPVLAWLNEQPVIGSHAHGLYVLAWDPGAGAWKETEPGSASGSGVRVLTIPALVKLAMGQDENGAPIIAFPFHENGAGDWEVGAVRLAGGRWAEIGSGSASGGGISNDPWDTGEPALGRDASGRPVLAYPSYDHVRGEWGVHVMQWWEETASWKPFGEGATTGTGIRGGTLGLLRFVGINNVAIGNDDVGNPVVAWVLAQPDYQPIGVYVRRWMEPPVDRTGPHVASFVPTEHVAGPVDHIDLTFSEPIDRATFTARDVVLTNPNGVPVRVRRVREITPTVFRIEVFRQRLLGEYRLTIGPDIRDLAGNPMDQDGDGQPGEPVEDRFTGTFKIVPRTFVFSFLGFCGQVGQDPPSGMETLRAAIAADPDLVGTVVAAPPLGWPSVGCRLLPSVVRRQMRAARLQVRQFLGTHQYDQRSDRAVLIGHSYGGNIAYELAVERAEGRRRQKPDPIEGLVTLDPIDWQKCSLFPATSSCNQANTIRPVPPGVSAENILNFVQRNPNEPEPVFTFSGNRFAGYQIGGVFDDSLGRGSDLVWGTNDDTQHSLIDDDLSPGSDGQLGTPDDQTLGIFPSVVRLLRRLVGS